MSRFFSLPVLNETIPSFFKNGKKGVKKLFSSLSDFAENPPESFVFIFTRANYARTAVYPIDQKVLFPFLAV